jgi:hypothetical protein
VGGKRCSVNSVERVSKRPFWFFLTVSR